MGLLIFFALVAAALLFLVDGVLQRSLPAPVARTRRERRCQRRARLWTGAVILLAVGTSFLALLALSRDSRADASVFAVAAFALFVALGRRLWTSARASR